AAAEACTDVTFSSYVRFSDAAPGEWGDIFGDDSNVPVLFIDDLDGGLSIRDHNIANLYLKVYYFASPGVGLPASPIGPDYSNLVDVTYTQPTGAGDGRLEIDLSGLDNIGGPDSKPSDEGVLWITYTLNASELMEIGDQTGTVDYS